MEEKKTIFDYMAQVLITYGISILILNLFCILFGEEAKEISTMFSMGNKGLSVATMLQYFGTSILVTFSRFVFFSDTFFKRLPIVLRTAGMLASITGIIIAFIIIFDWFPVDRWEPWVMFFVCLGISFLVSVGVTVLKEKAENRKMEEALRKLKEQKE